MSKEIERKAIEFEAAVGALEKRAQEGPSRKDFIEDASDDLIGGLKEYYKHCTVRNNGHIKWKDHWLTEAKGIGISEFDRRIRQNVKGISDKRKALNEIFQRVIDADHSKRKSALAEVIYDYDHNKIPNDGFPIALEDKDLEDYLSMAQTAFDRAADNNFKKVEEGENPRGRGRGHRR